MRLPRRASAPCSVQHQVVKSKRSLSLDDIEELNEDQKQDLKEAFGMFVSRKGKMSARDLGSFLRCLGWNPSERDLEEARQELDVAASGRLTFAEVEKFVRKRGGIYTKSEEECDIIEAFKVLDKDGTGKISIRDFRRCMTTLGDKMSDEEVEEILHFAKTKDGEFINYAEFFQKCQDYSSDEG
ncbi:CALM [Mytilus edulis]|uniref:CALM n=2 Tax=Mytilus edulis TaxID=6550 RepID=A0A8S3RXZ3_MYTED|nr:CALM [Mytilus edulis]